MPFQNNRICCGKSLQICIILIAACLVFNGESAFDIESYGAVAHADNINDHIANQKAIQAAINAASQSPIDRVVRVPEKTFYTMPFKF
jgi:polygalacturonase